jgi:hypothetical protein
MQPVLFALRHGFVQAGRVRKGDTQSFTKNWEREGLSALAFLFFSLFLFSSRKKKRKKRGPKGPRAPDNLLVERFRYRPQEA